MASLNVQRIAAPSMRPGVAIDCGPMSLRAKAAALGRPLSCPSCQRQLGADGGKALQIHREGDRRPLGPLPAGAVVGCLFCGAVLVVNDAGELRGMTVDEGRKLSPEVREALGQIWQRFCRH